MKKQNLYIALITVILSTIFVSCFDDNYQDCPVQNDKINIRFALNLPGGNSSVSTRTEGTSNGDATTEDGKSYENRLDEKDIHILLFQDGRFQEEVADFTVTGEDGAATRYVNGILTNEYKTNVEFAVFVNATGRGAQINTASLKGKTKEEVYKSIVYTYGKSEWVLDDAHENYIPMWGTYTFSSLQTGINTGTIKLYRAIAKMGVTVNEGNGLNNFQLMSIRVYYANTKGYCASIHTPNSDETIQFDKPWVNDSFEQINVSDPLKYTVNGDSFLDKIYVPESNNNAPGENRKPLCIVVGGLYSDDGLVENSKENFYRLDLKNENGIFDVIRNHYYIFNIKSVSNPGTPTPEEALDHAVIGMNIEITAWVDDYMRGIPDQYTLTTSESYINFDYNKNIAGTSKTTATIDVFTDYEYQEAIKNGNWIIDGVKDEWLIVNKINDNQITVSVNSKNNGISRTGYFYIQAGNIRKQIAVSQEQPETANCYLVGDGEHELIVTIKGNGNDGIYATSDKDPLLGNVKLIEDGDDASITPAKIGIIWETKAGLITLVDASGNRVTGSNLAEYDKSAGSIKYIVNSNGATIGDVRGGNALIGAFDDNNNVLWSWHIWVCPDMVENGELNSKYVEDWTLNGYEVIDRNLGALSNRPGVASLGLLYQWGRKDPFIGASTTNNNNSKDANVLPATVHHGSWGVEGTENKPLTVEETIEKPTKLTKAGLSKGGENRSALLWGTDGGLNKNGVKDLGSKTIYDPCPKGYRVPPVDAFVFVDPNLRKKQLSTYEVGCIIEPKGSWKRIYSVYYATTEKNCYISFQEDHSDAKFYEYIQIPKKKEYWRKDADIYKLVEKSSEVYNWNENLIYVPHKVSSVGTASDQFIEKNFSGSYKSDAHYYGFYLNYKSIKRPQITGANYDYDKNYDKEKNLSGDMYTLVDYTDITWLPLSGAYDPNANDELTFKGVNIQQGSSLTVNSFLWTNSSVKVGKELQPAAMFLHGTERNSSGSGRHIHGLTQSNINAEPQYAGAVRCVRDVQKDFSASNQVPGEANFGKLSEVSITIISINDTWKVIDPGASWFKISPDNGTADKGRGQVITFTITKPRTDNAERTATVQIQFTNESKPRKIVVTQPAL